MRMRESLMAALFLSFGCVTAKAALPLNNELNKLANFGNDITANMTLGSALSPLISEDRLFGSAYYDTLRILSTRNQCSEFFGGPETSVDVFNQLIGRMKKEYFSGSISMRMSGWVINLVDAKSMRGYRLFDKVSLNAGGPFYRNRFSRSEPSVAGVGTFEPNTREVRVLIFLHELAHALQGEDGEWLLPDDGDNEKLSRLNSRKIEEICGDQIHSLGKAQARTYPPGKKHYSVVHEMKTDSLRG